MQLLKIVRKISVKTASVRLKKYFTLKTYLNVPLFLPKGHVPMVFLLGAKEGTRFAVHLYEGFTARMTLIIEGKGIIIL